MTLRIQPVHKSAQIGQMCPPRAPKLRYRRHQRAHAPTRSVNKSRPTPPPRTTTMHVRTAADTNTRAPATSLSITAQEDEAAAEADTRHVIEVEQALRRYG